MKPLMHKIGKILYFRDSTPTVYFNLIGLSPMSTDVVLIKDFKKLKKKIINKLNFTRKLPNINFQVRHLEM